MGVVVNGRAVKEVVTSRPCHRSMPPSDYVSFLNRGFNFNFWIYQLFTTVTVTYRHNHWYSRSHSQVSFRPDSTVHRFDKLDSIHLARYVSIYPTNPNT
ncbi:unnamed protein product [Penicillium nalgiovense]|nr:unnamed protein product [Penicillium nalgiovense]CAG8094869.1 unnamed protein product [Penicillium nalgiovense]CAG8133660.1 unnamed protein product [Penicillium nalgiovense]CAG8154140.1 unnamed protein product [Penicillium nalgiovense]CAG8159599.1 unnamed protein product [Penicillium nalgiovense]